MRPDISPGFSPGADVWTESLSELNDGTEQLISVREIRYFENIPENNVGVVA
jgi:hypothetical protein